MTFLNPLFLIGLAAAGIPLIIHLFNFRRPKKIDFSSLVFLKELQKSTMQRVRIKQILLLILRTLVIACLALAFARPTLTGGLGGALGGRASTSMAILVDNSRSMQLRDAQGAYLDQAKEIATLLVDQTQPGDEVFIIPSSGQASVQPTAYNLSSLALDAVEELEVMPAAALISDAWMRARKALEGASNLNKEIYLISDLQKSTFVDSTLDGNAGAIRTYMIPLGTRNQSNVAVTHVEVVSRIIEVGQPVKLEATLVNFGEEAIEGYVASVFLDGERVAQASADLEPRVPQVLEFIATPQRRGWLPGIVQIEDDAFGSDNIRYFTLNVPEQRQLLVVRGEQQKTDFLELALSPGLTRGRVAFQIETIDEAGLSLKRLGTYDAVMLVGVRSLSSGEIATLREYVEEGGGILFFPGEAGIAADYNGLFSALEGGRFSGFSGSLSTRQPVASFDRVDLEHPLFEGVFEQQQGLRQQIVVEDPQLYYAMNYTPGSATEQTLIQLSNSFPFMQEVRYGRGAMFLMAVAPDLNWSDFPRRGLFIPLIYRSMYYLSSGESVSGEQHVIGRLAELRVPGVGESGSIRIIAPDGEEYAPEQRNVLGALVLQFDADLQKPGIYDVMAGDQLVRRIAFNLDEQESDLLAIERESAVAQLEAMTNGPVRILDTAAAGGVSRVMESLQQERTGIELWNVFLLLALIFMVVEMLVAKQWRPEAVAA